MIGRRERRTFIVGFLAPAFLLYTVFVAIPSVRALLYSLQKWDGLSPPQWVGLQNFAQLFSDNGAFLATFTRNSFGVVGVALLLLILAATGTLYLRNRQRGAVRISALMLYGLSALAIWLQAELLYSLVRVDNSGLFFVALKHNVILIALGGSLTLLLALFFAGLLHRRIRGAGLFRVAFFFPNVISSVAVSLLWLLLYSTTDFGVINGALKLIQHGLASVGCGGLPFDVPFPFILSKNLIYAIVPMMVWSAAGFYMVLFLAAMENIPETFYEVARLEGASGPAQFWHITLPLIREVLTVGLVFLVIGCLKIFDAIWIMENQWPTPDSHVLGTLLYQKVFTEYNVGYGSAVAVLLFILVFFATLITLRLSRREAVEY